MFFELDEAQYTLRDMARDLFAEVAPLSRLRGQDPGPRADPGVWARLGESGLTGIGVPEDAGGSGGDEVDAVVVIEQAGYALLPEPVRETLGIVAPLLHGHGSREQRDRWLAPLAAGRTMVGQALAPHGLLAAHRSVEGAVVAMDGRCLLVHVDDLELRARRTVDPARDLATIVTVRADDAAVLPQAVLDDVHARGAAATAAALVGVAQRLLNTAVAHARVREQFGTPIGAFQAVQHALVDVHVAVETARAAVWYAALTARDGAPDAVRAARVAKVAAGDAAERADWVALQVLAGIGFTWEHELHLLSKRATAWRAEFGDARTHRREIAGTLRP